MYLAHYTKRFIPEFDAECRIYNQYQYLDEMRHAYDVWYQQLETIIEPTGFPFNWRFGQ